MSISSLFFKETLPLIPKPKQGECCCIPSDYETRVSVVKKMGISVSALAVALFTYVTYESSKTLMQYSIDDPRSIFSLVLLGIEGIGLTAASCCYVAFRRFRNKLLNEFPHRDYYVGSLLTPYGYMLEQTELKGEKACSHAIETIIAAIKKRGLWDKWYEMKGFSDEEEATKHLFEELRKGLCYGNTMELLSLMPKFSKSSSQNLIKKLNFEKKLYFQILESLLVDLLKKEDGIDCVVLSFAKDMSEEEVDAELKSPSFSCSRDYFFLRVIGVGFKEFIFHEQKSRDLKAYSEEKLKTDFEEGISRLKAKSNDQLIDVTGFVGLYPSEESHETAGHALFFQLSTDRRRFHDSGHWLAGFFEFPSDELFFKYLLTHIQTWPTYKEGSYKISFFSFPKAVEHPSTIVIDP